MTERRDDIAAAIERVAVARGAEVDADWARQVAGAMVMKDVCEAPVIEALDHVAEQLAAVDEPARELFGDPYQWAREQRSLWREAGVDHVAPSLLVPRDLVIETLIIACLLGGLFFLYALITWSWDDPFTLSWLAAPLALAVTCRATEAAFTSVRAARSQTAGVVVGVLAVGIGTVLTVGVFAVGNTVTIGGRAAVGALGSALAYAALAWIVAKLWPERPAQRATTVPLDEDEWLRALGAALRARGDMTDARVAAIVNDTRAHARDAGAPLVEEFGPPRSYAARFAKNRAVTRQRKAWLSTTIAIGVLGYNLMTLIDGSASIWGVVWLLLITVIAILAWRDTRRPA